MTLPAERIAEFRRWAADRARAAERAANGGRIPDDEQEVVDAPDGDPRKRGTITAEVPMPRHSTVSLTPAPPDHPGWGEQIMVPPTADELGLVTARDLDAALRIARR